MVKRMRGKRSLFILIFFLIMITIIIYHLLPKKDYNQDLGIGDGQCIVCSFNVSIVRITEVDEQLIFNVSLRIYTNCSQGVNILAIAPIHMTLISINPIPQFLATNGTTVNIIFYSNTIDYIVKVAKKQSDNTFLEDKIKKYLNKSTYKIGINITYSYSDRINYSIILFNKILAGYLWDKYALDYSLRIFAMPTGSYDESHVIKLVIVNNGKKSVYLERIKAHLNILYESNHTLARTLNYTRSLPHILLKPGSKYTTKLFIYDVVDIDPYYYILYTLGNFTIKIYYVGEDNVKRYQVYRAMYRM